MKYAVLLPMLLTYACAPVSRSADSARVADSARRAQAADTGPLLDGSRLEPDVPVTPSDAAAPTRPLTAEDSLPTVVEDRTIQSPRLARIGHRSIVHLPARMMAALVTGAPGFRAFTRADYSASASDSIYGDASKEAPFAVVGDFDGNGTLDVALYGRDTSVVLLAIIDDARGPHVVEVTRDTDEESPAIQGYLTYNAPRTLKDADDQPLVIKHDFFSMEHEASSVIYYMINGAFVSQAFGD